jgi:hypothetical protein
VTSILRPLASLALALAALLPAGPAQALWQPNGSPVCAAAGDQSRPVVVPDGQGGAYIVWEDARTLPPQVYAQHLNALGDPLWAADGIRVSSGTYSQTAPVAVGDGVGGVIIAWILQIVPEARTAQGQRLNAAGAPVWTAGGIPMTPGPAFPVQLAIISDGRQPLIQTPGVILAWTDIRNGATTDLYARAIDSAGGARWDATVCAAPGNQKDLVMVSDNVGGTLTQPRGAILAWRDQRVTVEDEDLYAQRLSAAGAVQWTPDGLPVDVSTTGVLEPSLVPAGGGTAIVAWPGPSGGRAFSLWAQRMGTLGAWPGLGALVAPPGNNQTQQAAIPDGAGGIVVSWSAFGPGLNRNVYIQRLSSTGAPVWASEGTPVCDVPGAQGEPVLVTGRNQGAIVAWEDRRPIGEADVYAQLMSGDGVPQWNPGGVPLCIAPGDQLELAAVADTTGGAIVAWTDARNGNRDIYAQRITGWGGVVAVPGLVQAARSAGLRLGAPFPNPARAGLSVRFDLPRAGGVTAAVFDAAGRHVRTLLAGEAREAGTHALAWDGEGEGRARVGPGVYWVVVRALDDEARRRAVVLP